MKFIEINDSKNTSKKKCFPAKIHGSVCIGDKIRLSDIALDNYGYKMNQIYTISHVARNEQEHRGYDSGMSPQLLVDCEELNFSLYEYEFELVDLSSSNNKSEKKDSLLNGRIQIIATKDSSANPRIELIEKITNSLENDFKILDYVKYHQEDYFRWVKNDLSYIREVQPRFILGLRETGMDIIVFAEVENWLKEFELEDRAMYKERRSVFAFNNDRYLYFDGDYIAEIKREDALKLYEEFIEKAMKLPPIKRDSPLFTSAKLRIISNLANAASLQLFSYEKELRDNSEIYYANCLEEYLKRKEYTLTSPIPIHMQRFFQEYTFDPRRYREVRNSEERIFMEVVRDVYIRMFQTQTFIGVKTDGVEKGLNLLSSEHKSKLADYLNGKKWNYFGAQPINNASFLTKRVNALYINTKGQLVITMDADFDDDYFPPFLVHLFQYLKDNDLWNAWSGIVYQKS